MWQLDSQWLNNVVLLHKLVFVKSQHLCKATQETTFFSAWEFWDIYSRQTLKEMTGNFRRGRFTPALFNEQIYFSIT